MDLDVPDSLTRQGCLVFDAGSQCDVEGMMMAAWSQTWTFFDGAWLEGNPGIFGPRTHAVWLGSSVFDGGRAFEGVTPDIDLHLARVNRSATALKLKPTMTVEAMAENTAKGASFIT